ncbi:MAG: flagellar motor switch protein FliM [Hyphomonadaceae bacterium]|nr:flagellar motor switch protein FliM [Clostridia bacterium]
MARYSPDDDNELRTPYRPTGSAHVRETPQQPSENYEKIRLYNFRIPNRFTKEQLRALKGIYENFASSLASHLSGLLRKFCLVELISVEEHTFSEFNNAMVDPVLLVIIALQPLQGVSLMEISPSVAYGIIDRLLGGIGQFSNPDRDYTEIEIALMEKLIGQFLDIMKESWVRFHEVTPKLERIETRSQFAQIVPANETIAIVTFSVKIGEVEGMINYCIPHVGVEPLFKDTKFKSDFFQSNQPNENSKADVILNHIEKASIEMLATFSETNITAREVMSMQVGDVLLMDHKVADAVHVKINNSIKFTGYLGIKNNRRSIKINKTMNEDDFTGF